jgi:hypothetical protein
MLDLGMGGGTSRFDSVHGRSGDGLFHGTLRYPSPFFDIGHTYLPTSVQHLFRWCRYYFLVNPLINAVTYKMAEYPITPLIFEEEDPQIRARWENIAENDLKLRAFQIECGLDYFCYGNSFISVYFPFVKLLSCNNCGFEVPVSKAGYKFRNLKYYLTCDKCGVTSEAKVKDHNIKNLKGIRLIRWNPEYVKVEHNEATGQTDYFYEIPQTLKNDILIGKRHIVETIPHVFIQSMQQSKTIKFTEDNLFHLKRPTIAQKDMGWGMPLILPVLKDTFYLQVLRKGQEAIAQQHIVPLRILFPQAGSNSSDPYSMADLGLWRKRIEAEIAKWRSDANYIPILPLPVGNEVIGGEGRALMLHQEMRAWSEQIVAGMHVPIEFVFGGMQYSGSNVSMRMLENQFLGYRLMQHVLINDFILGRIADYMGLPRPKCRFKRFKMADDLQRSALIFQLNQAQKISDTTLLDDLDYDVVQEEKFKKVELGKQMENQRKMQLAAAALQGEVLVVSTKYQVLAQKAMAAAGLDPSQVSGGGQGGGQGGGGSGGAAPAQASAMPTIDGSEKDADPMQQAIKQFSDQMQQQLASGQTNPRSWDTAPGMPEGATTYAENAGQNPAEGIPDYAQSPLQGGMQQNGMSVMYLARRAATALEKLDEGKRQMELIKMRGINPNLYQVVQQMLTEGKGSQTDSLNPLQSPLPEVKPPRGKNGK